MITQIMTPAVQNYTWHSHCYLTLCSMQLTFDNDLIDSSCQEVILHNEEQYHKFSLMNARTYSQRKTAHKCYTRARQQYTVLHSTGCL